MKAILKRLILVVSLVTFAFAVGCNGDNSSSTGGSTDSPSTGEQGNKAVATYIVEYYFESETEIGVYTKNETMTFSNTTVVGTLLKPDKVNLPQYELNEEKSSPEEGILPEEGITFTYYYKIRTYTVEFLANGGSTVETQFIRHGAKATQPNTPTHSNPDAKFHGWLTENNQVYDFNVSVERNIVLTADWEIPQYGPIV